MDISKCLGCMEAYQGYPCPNCGFDPQKEQVTEYALPGETILAGKYMIGKLLGQGGFGLTYIGWDLALERKVAIKESYPAGQVSRSPGTRRLTWYTGEQAQFARQEGMKMFLKEARKMAKVDKIPNVVRVLDIFQENETAYIVMDFVEGETLKSRLKRTGPLSWDEAKEIFLPAIRAMAAVHKQSIIHRDLSPDNLMLTKDGDVQILDMGAAKDLNISVGASTMNVAKPGFSPWEQYTQRGNSGTWTDVYAMAATIYYTLTGKVPPIATDRMEEDHINWSLPGLETLPPKALGALKKAMAVKAEARIQTMEELERALYLPTTPPPPPPPPKRIGILIASVAAVLVCIITLSLWLNRKPDETIPASLEVTTEATAEADKVTITEPTTAPTTAPTTVPTTAPLPTEHQHTFDTAWKSSDYKHWHAATCEHHTQVSEVGIHQWGAGEVSKKPTHTDEGEKRFTCTVCGYQKTETLSKSPHVYDQKVVAEQFLASAATYDSPALYYWSCICGEKTERTFPDGSALQQAPHEHTFDTAWESSTIKHWHAATCEHHTEVSEAGDHQWDAGKVTKQPTHTASGKKVYTCKVCDYQKTETLSKVTNHVFDQKKAEKQYLASAATYKSPAQYYKSCSICGEKGKETFSYGSALSGDELLAQGKYMEAMWTYKKLGYKAKANEAKELYIASQRRMTIACNDDCTLFLQNDGTVKITGSILEQEKIEGWNNIVSISSGAAHAVGLRSDGMVVAAGYNTDDQCNVESWKYKDIVAVTAGHYYTLGLCSNGTVVAVGHNGYRQCNVSEWTNIVALAAGFSHTVGLKADGTVVGAGSTTSGVLNVGKWENIVAVAAGFSHTVGLKADGTVLAVGDNDYGQCNVGEWTDIVAVAAGAYHTVGLKADGTVVAVGKNDKGQCDVSKWTNVVAVAARRDRTMVRYLR